MIRRYYLAWSRISSETIEHARIGNLSRREQILANAAMRVLWLMADRQGRYLGVNLNDAARAITGLGVDMLEALGWVEPWGCIRHERQLSLIRRMRR